LPDLAFFFSGKAKTPDFYVKFLDLKILATNFFKCLMYYVGQINMGTDCIHPEASRPEPSKQTISSHPRSSSWDCQRAYTLPLRRLG
jgi:hypothetical protein